MRFAIGYQLPTESDSISEIVEDYRESVAEVYFALPDDASGRSPLTREGWSKEEAEEVLLEELANLARMDVGAVLLFNAACYGGHAMSHDLKDRVLEGLALVEQATPLAAVTTTSLFIARLLKCERPDTPVRASVNMRTGSIAAMEQLAGAFDGYYMKRELNRSPEVIAELKAWCDDNGKALHLLANSGCLYDCAYQSFHDNLVAHEHEAVQVSGPSSRYRAPCWEYLEEPSRQHGVLRNTWIRPEDLYHYGQWFDICKLATRMHSYPRMVLGAYVRGRHRGDLLDLLEPGHGALPGMPVLDNRLFPEDWYDRISTCEHRCQDCSYCASVFSRVRQSPLGECDPNACHGCNACKGRVVTCDV